MNTDLDARLERFVPRPTAAGDWPDVLVRAGESRPRQRSRGGLVVGAVLTATALAAGAAFALGRPLQKKVESRFFGDSPAAWDARITQSVDGETWTAGVLQNDRGETCLPILLPDGKRESGCLGTSALFRDGPLVVSMGATGIGTGVYVHGLVAPAVTRVELVFDDCSTRRLPLSARFFFWATSNYDRPPTKIVAYDAADRFMASRILGSDRTDWNPSSAACRAS